MHCKNCHAPLSGSFCSQCGEKVYTDHDRTVKHFFEEGLHFLTHFEGKFLTTLKTIFRYPGKLSVDYCNGIRKKYFKPVSLFLMLVIIYLLFPLVRGLNMRFQDHLQQPLYGQVATNMANRYFEKHPGIDDTTFLNAYDARSEKMSKLLLLLLIPFTAVVLHLGGRKKRRHFFDAMVLSTEINSLLLLLGFFVLSMLIKGLVALLQLVNIQVPYPEITLSLLTYFGFFIFAAIAIQRFYRFKKGFLWFWLPLFAILHIFIVYFLYKFILFATVMILL